MKTETFDNPADFLAALNGGRKRAKDARPSLPRAGSVDRVGMSGLIAGKTRTWHYEYTVARGHRFYTQTQDTGYYAELSAACNAAKGME